MKQDHNLALLNALQVYGNDAKHHTLSLDSSGHHGEIRTRDGAIVGAVFDHLSGRDALDAMIEDSSLGVCIDDGSGNETDDGMHQSVNDVVRQSVRFHRTGDENDLMDFNPELNETAPIPQPKPYGLNLKTMMVVLESDGDPSGTFTLSKGETMVGKFDDYRVQLNHPSVSRHHAKFTLSDESIYLEDLGSMNGTYVNGRQVMSIYLHPNDVVQFGTVCMTLRLYLKRPVGECDRGGGDA